MREFIKRLRAQLDELLEQRATVVAERDGIIATVEAEARAELTADETSKITEARGKLATIDAQKAALEARIAELETEANADDAAAELRKSLGLTETAAPGRVTNEPRTYTRELDVRGERSFFVDSFRSQFANDGAARDRLERHSREVIVEREAPAELRATTTGSFAGLVVPQYLVEAAAAVLRSGRPVANRVNRMPLPEQGTSFNIPRGTTGASVASQNPENTSVSSTDEVWANLTITLATLAGQQDVSRQSLERGTPGIDEIVYLDLAGAYAAELDRQVLNGSGASGQMQGIIGTSGINAGTAFGAAVTAANFYTKVAGAQNGVMSNRFLPPTAIYMHPRRFAWAMAQSDSTGRPLIVPTGNGAFNAQGSLDEATVGVVGSLQGLPVVVDPNIPTNVGAATGGEDVVLVLRESDCWLWEDGDGAPRQLRFEQTLGNQLTVKLVVYGYAAFTAGRYPVAVSKFGGLDTTTNGLVAPTF
jgi:HK97 family phage major capsid protein